MVKKLFLVFTSACGLRSTYVYTPCGTLFKQHDFAKEPIFGGPRNETPDYTFRYVCYYCGYTTYSLPLPL